MGVFRKILTTLAFAAALLCFAAPSFAYQWTLTSNNPPPQDYANFNGAAHEYFYEQQTRFYVNENGFNLGTSGAGFIGEMWASVFANPNDQNSGLTAITSLDMGNPANTTDFTNIEQNFLYPFDIPDPGGDWEVSPYWNLATNPEHSFFSDQSGLDWDVPLHMWVDPGATGTITPSGVTLELPPGPNYTIGGSSPYPYPLFVGVPADVGSGYYGSNAAYWEAVGNTSDFGDAGGWSNMSEQGAITAFNDYGTPGIGVKQGGASTGNVIVSYPFGTEIATLDVSNGTATCTALNPTPYDVIGEKYYAYVEASNQYGEYGNPQLLTQGTVNISPMTSKASVPNYSQFTFNVPASDAGDELIVTLNETLNSNGSVTPEPLSVYDAYGPNCYDNVGAAALTDNSPKDEIAAINNYSIFSTAGKDYDPSGTPAAYADNAMYLMLAGSSGGGTSPALVVTPLSATVSVGGQQQYKATYYPTGTGGTGQDVTTSSNTQWYSGNTGIATVIVTGSSGGLATGVSQGTTGITADYNSLQGSAQINVTQGVVPSGYNLQVTNLSLGVPSSGLVPGNSYNATATFSTNTPFAVTNPQVWWYYNAGNGWTGINPISEPITIPVNGSVQASMQWTFPSSATSVQVMATIDDPYVNGFFQNKPIPGTTNQMETTYQDNTDQSEASINESPPPQSLEQLINGTAYLPQTITQTETVQTPYTYWVYNWTEVPIVNGPNQTWGPPHYYLSY